MNKMFHNTKGNTLAYHANAYANNKKIIAQGETH